MADSLPDDARMRVSGRWLRWQVRPGRWMLQSRTLHGAPPRVYLVRVLVDVDREPPEIVTAYRTSRITKYWRRD